MTTPHVVVVSESWHPLSFAPDNSCAWVAEVDGADGQSQLLQIIGWAVVAVYDRYGQRLGNVGPVITPVLVTSTGDVISAQALSRQLGNEGAWRLVPGEAVE